MINSAALLLPLARTGVVAKINHALLRQAREAAGRQASPSAASSAASRSRPRRASVRKDMTQANTSSNASVTSSPTRQGSISLLVHTADIQDRDGAVSLLASIRHSFPWWRHVLPTVAMPDRN